MKIRHLAMGLALSLAGPATAQTLLDGHGPDAWAVTGVASNDVLNLRAGPSTDYVKIGQLAPYARGIEMLVCVPTLTYQQYQWLSDAGHKFPPRWCLVSLDGERGWANARYLEED
ncbi:SH3 domain-containing protein [Roseovarius pelagicus]|uniref:SH3 domain-containing protein n=1 Tax=Roseovarius pelagicus TaxID=2980108 RepID=A0ABY6DDK9_9RHOB|nr:SH3 domain-containing protein [Roseovarius pelagicus]UXX84226.1 SH3 domain-containing protein [Roseovarius pelagicus]